MESKSERVAGYQNGQTVFLAKECAGLGRGARVEVVETYTDGDRVPLVLVRSARSGKFYAFEDELTLIPPRDAE